MCERLPAAIILVCYAGNWIPARAAAPHSGLDNDCSREQSVLKLYLIGVVLFAVLQQIWQASMQKRRRH